MTAFLWRLRTWRSYQALWLTPPSYHHPLHVTPDSERMKSSSVSWKRLSMSSGSNGLCLRSHLATGWNIFFSQGAIKPPANAHPPSSPKFMTSSRYCGTPPTRLASVLLLPLLSYQLTTLKRKDASACPFWMSPWPRISAARGYRMEGEGEPSVQAVHLHSPDTTYSAAGQASLALPICSQSLEWFQPLATWANAWQAILGVSSG